MGRNKETIVISSNIPLELYGKLRQITPNISAFMLALIRKYFAEKEGSFNPGK